jgi:hypothetical protein
METAPTNDDSPETPRNQPSEKESIEATSQKPRCRSTRGGAVGQRISRGSLPANGRTGSQISSIHDTGAAHGTREKSSCGVGCGTGAEAEKEILKIISAFLQFQLASGR